MGRSVNPRPQLFDSAGDPLISGKMYFYESETDTPKTTYADVNLTIPNAHPVVLTADGRLPNVFFDGAARQVLTDNADVQIWDVDPVGDSTLGGNFEQWVPSVSYSVNDIVEGSDGNFYKSFTSGNLGNDPTTTPTEWQEVDFINTWNTNVSYDLGDTVKASDNLFYTSNVNNNLGNDPTTDAVNWSSSFSGVASVTGGTGITLTGTATDPVVNADNNGTVESVNSGTNITVDNTDPDNPIINNSSNAVVATVVGGTGVTVDATDPENPIVNADNNGDVVGPAGATDGATATFDGATGKLLKDGVVLGTVATLDSGTGSGNVPLVGTKSATEALAGLTELATQAEAEAGTDDTVVLTALGGAQAIAALASSGPTLGTPTATTSGTSHDYPSIPAGTAQITVSFAGVSVSGSSIPIIQIGDSGGVETSGYAGTVQAIADASTTLLSTGFSISQSGSAGKIFHGAMILTLVDASTNTWSCIHIIGQSNTATVYWTAGTKSLSAELDRVRLTTVGGTDTFDAGKFNILYQ